MIFVIINKNGEQKWLRNFVAVLEKKLIFTEGTEKGSITKNIKETDIGYDWDIIFKPFENNDRNLVYANLDKNNRSMRKKAWENLIDKLEKEEICSPDMKEYKKI